MSRTHRGLTVLAIVLAVAGCPKELPRDLPAGELYRLGHEFYDKQRWDRAIETLERFLFQDPGHPKADSAQYLVGDSYFHQKQYLTAASEFLRLAQNRPASPLADDSRYRACESYYKLSPRPELDQEYTQEAIDQCRSVVLLYPQSPYAPKASERVKELTDKLARKYYLNAVYYYSRHAYDSAIVYLEHLLEEYRGAAVEPQALLKLYQTYVKVGYMQEAERTRDRLVREYPNSPEAQKVQETSSSEAG